MAHSIFIKSVRTASALVALTTGVFCDVECPYCLGEACFENESATAGANINEPFWIKCMGEDDEEYKICVTEGDTCLDQTPAQWCNFHFTGDKNTEPPDVNFSPWQMGPGSCSESDSPIAHSPCQPWPGPDTAGDDPTTGGMNDNEEQRWICNPDSHEMCFLYFDPSLGETRDTAISKPADHAKCWTEPPALTRCFKGTKVDAVKACAADCGHEREASEADCAAIGDLVVDELAGETHDTWVCDDFDSTIAPAGNAPCEEIMPASEGAPLKHFNATVMIAGADGGNTSQAGLRGYLGLKTENCTATKCDFIVDAIEGHAKDLDGVYSDATGSQVTYSAENVDFRLTEALRGEWYPSRGTVVFPTGLASVIASANTISIESFGLPDTAGGANVEQIAGTYRSGHLSLSLSYSLPGVLVVMSIETTE